VFNIVSDDTAIEINSVTKEQRPLQQVCLNFKLNGVSRIDYVKLFACDMDAIPDHYSVGDLVPMEVNTGIPKGCYAPGTLITDKVVACGENCFESVEDVKLETTQLDNSGIRVGLLEGKYKIVLGVEGTVNQVLGFYTFYGGIFDKVMSVSPATIMNSGDDPLVHDQVVFSLDDPKNNIIEIAEPNHFGIYELTDNSVAPFSIQLPPNAVGAVFYVYPKDGTKDERFFSRNINPLYGWPPPGKGRGDDAYDRLLRSFIDSYYVNVNNYKELVEAVPQYVTLKGDESSYNIKVPRKEDLVYLERDKVRFGGSTYGDFYLLPTGCYTYELAYSTENPTKIYTASANFGVVWHGDETPTCPPYVSITPVVNEQFTVYPNPTDGQLIIDNGELKIENVEVFNITGQSVYSSTCPLSPAGGGRGWFSSTLNISNLPTGIYFIRIQTENGVITKKVIKN
jgi:hypothetical protein